MPKEPEKDTQLQYALNMLRGTLPGATGADVAKPADAPAAAAPAGGEDEKKAMPN